MNQPEQSRDSSSSEPKEVLPDAIAPIIDSSLREGTLPAPDSQTINSFTAQLAQALDTDQLHDFEEQLYDDQTGLQGVLLFKACHHLLALNLEKLERAIPNPDELFSLERLGEIALATVFHRISENTLSLEEQTKTIELTTRIGDLVVARLLEEEEAPAALRASLAVLSVATTITMSNEDLLDLLPRKQLSAATECVEHLLTRFLLQPVHAPHVEHSDSDGLISQACQLAAGIKSPELAPLLRTAYEALDSQMVELLTDTEDERHIDENISPIPFDSTMPISNSPDLIDAVFSSPEGLTPAPSPAAIRLEQLRYLSLTCLRALALSAAELDDVEVFEYFLDGPPDNPEYAESLLGLAMFEPQAALPYIQQSLGHAAEGELAAIQAIFNLIDRQVATTELTSALINRGEERGYQTLIVLHAFTEEYRTIAKQSGTIPGHDFAVEVKVHMPEDSHGILLRAKTVALFEDLLGACTDAWDSQSPADET